MFEINEIQNSFNNLESKYYDEELIYLKAIELENKLKSTLNCNQSKLLIEMEKEFLDLYNLKQKRLIKFTIDNYS